MKKVFFLIIILIFLTGCDFVQDLGYKVQDVFDYQFISDSETSARSVGAEFIVPRSGSIVSEALPFNPRIKINNPGNFDVSGQVCISGIDRAFFKGFSGCDCLQFYSYDDYDRIYVEDVVFGPYEIDSSAPRNNVLTALVRYETSSKATFRMCVSENAYAMQECRVRIVSQKNGPVAITNIEEIITHVTPESVSVTFNIELTNRGRGVIWDRLMVYDLCRPLTDPDPKIEAILTNVPFIGNVYCGNVKVTDEKNIAIKCDIPNFRLYGDTGYLYQDFRPELTLEVSYAYQEIISSDFKLG